MAGAGHLYDLAIVGAGSAGLAAAKTARALGLDFVLLEASHRVGGRGYTEALAPDVAFDLGCHWMHSASLNPYVAIADRFGFTYRKGTFPRGLRLDGRWASAEERAALDRAWEEREAAIAAAAMAGKGLSVAEATEREGRWTALLDYWTSIATAADPDQVAVEDVVNYNDTDENWPLKEGFGALIARFGADAPVTLNCKVERIAWSRAEIALDTSKGTLRAKRAIVTVSTGILGAGDIRFDPPLPDWKLEAIAGLPLGTHNRIGLLFDRDPFGPDCPKGAGFLVPGEEPIGFALRPFDQNYAVAYTGGRFALWLERAGQAAAIDFAKEKLAKAFGSTIKKHVTRAIVTAWAGDPWVKGSYSAALPGQAHQRAALARPIEDRLFFAGEACSAEFFATAHGAYIAGVEAARAVAHSLGREVEAAASAE
ncbi:MAG: flavin monoamine oxidase family protein [Pseudomonadota bacterium]